jgi:hypothetical protein
VSEHDLTRIMLTIYFYPMFTMTCNV